MIDTLAGTGWQGYAGDSGPAASAALRFPRGVATDTAGNLYVADPRDHRVRRIDAEGMITTLAGTGQRGYTGDGAPAAEARLDHPEGVAADRAGNVYVADSANHRIRRIDAEGTITTLAGTGERGYSGDGGLAAEARLAFPADVAVDASGNVYVADSWNHRVRRIDAEGTITTLAGSGFPGYSGDGSQASGAFLSNPTAVAVDASGNVYVADSWNHRVRRIDQSGSISTLAGSGGQDDGGDGGPGVTAGLAYPVSVAAGPEGSLYVITYSFEDANHRVRRIGGTGVITAYAGAGEEGYEGDGGPAREARLAYPTGIAADTAGNVYIADSRNARIRVVRPGWQASVPLGLSGEILALVVDVEAGGVLTLGGEPVAPGRRVEAENGNTYALMAGSEGGVVAEYVPEMQRLQIASGEVTLTRQEDSTWRIGDETVENGHRYSIGSREYVLELANGRWGLPEFVIETAAGNTDVVDGIAATATTLDWLDGVAADATGNVYVAEYSRDRVRKIDLSGVVTNFAGTGNWGYSGDGGPATEAQLEQPRGIVVDEAGRVYVADSANGRIRRIDPSGVITTIAGGGACCRLRDGGPATEAWLSSPSDVALNGSGNIYVTERLNGRIRTIDPTGTITTIAGTGERGYSGDGGPAIEAQLGFLDGIALDSSGNIYVADYENSRIRRIDPAGMITTFAGTGEEGYSGDGGPATEARLDRAQGVAVDEAGRLYIADSANGRIRRVDQSGVITTIAGGGPCCSRRDGGPAVEAYVGFPRAVDVDGMGNVFATEFQTIRRIDSGGTITTFAGSGASPGTEDGGMALEIPLDSPAGIAPFAPGEVVFSDRGRVWKLDASGMMTPFAGSGRWGYSGDGGPATAAELRNPGPIAADGAGKIHFADVSNWRIRTVDQAGVISTLAGTGEAGFSGDGGLASEARLGRVCEIAADTMGNVYVASQTSYRIRKIDTAGRISTIAGTGERGGDGDGGMATLARLSDPCRGLVPDRAGNVYVSDGRQIRKIDASGVIAAVKNLGSWSIWTESLALDEVGNLLVAGEHRVLRINGEGDVSAIAGAGDSGYGGDGGPARSGGFSVRQMAVDRGDNIWLADNRSRRIRVLRNQRY